MNERGFSVDREQLLADLLGDSSAHLNGVSLTSLQAPIPTEPLEPLELSIPPSVQGRLCGDGDGSVGIHDETRARLKALGIDLPADAPLSKRVPCILCGHDHAARVTFTRFTNARSSRAGFPKYYCDDLPQGAGLGEIRAFIAYGGVQEITSLEAARWRELLDYEAGLRWPLPLRVEVPEPCPEPARLLAARMLLFVALRSGPFQLAEPIVFTGEFAQAYSGLSADVVRGAKDWLERAGVIYRAGTHRGAILWKLAAQDVYAAHGGNGSQR